MTRQDSFLIFLEDQLESLVSFEARRMFGGHGLYHEGVFFGILHQGRLYLHTTPKTAPRYIHAGMAPFQPAPRQQLKHYYEVPVAVLEDRDELASWVLQAIAGRAPVYPADE
jgi:DNA transformation protein